jgi:hypothetical protein
MLSLSRSSVRRVASAVLNVPRRFYAIEEDSLHVKRAAKPPIFEDVVPTIPTQMLRKRPPQTQSALSSLEQALPNLPTIAALAATPQACESSQLSNGVRIISKLNSSPGSVIGVALDAGTRHERESERGATLFAERLAFKVRVRGRERLTD